MIGRDDLADRGEFMLAGSRMSRIDEWQPLVTAWTSARTTDEIIEAALAHNVPVAPVCNGRAVVELDHVIARESLVDDPGGRFRMPRRPWRLNDDRGPDPRTRRPTLSDAPHGTPRWRDRAPAWCRHPVTRSPSDVRSPDCGCWTSPRGGPARPPPSLLAAFGADVIHVEGPGRMDGMRMVGMSFPGRADWWEWSPFFLTINVNKRDLVLDLTSDRGQAARAGADRARRRRRRELHAPRPRQARPRLGLRCTRPTRGPSRCGCRRSGSTGRGGNGPASPRTSSRRRASRG